MTKIYVDGVEYEEVDPSMVEDDCIVIRPVKVEPKWEVTNICGVGWTKVVVRLEPHIPEVQAQLIEAAITNFMEYIMGNTDYDDGFMDLADKARQAMKGDK